MNAFVVDTNVVIAANGRNTHADVICQLACIEKLEWLVKGGLVAIDDQDLILNEYRGYCHFSGQPGVGDAFFRHVFNSQHRNERVSRVQLTPSDDDRRGFEELPENGFDRSDRKFLAVAVVVRGVVLNATDSDWYENQELMGELDVEVEQLCPQHARKRR